jgi:hypothetical protein
LFGVFYELKKQTSNGALTLLSFLFLSIFESGGQVADSRVLSVALVPFFLSPVLKITKA